MKKLIGLNLLMAIVAAAPPGASYEYSVTINGMST